VIADPVPGGSLLQRLGEQLLGIEDLHATFTHRLGERVVLLLGALHPDHVVEQQVRGV
jgi:hypothetical protein